MDREATARRGRRREIAEALEDERNREAALHEQLELVVTEEEGPQIDAELMALLAPDELALVEDLLAEPIERDGDPDDGSAEEIEDTEQDESEVTRLLEEIDESRARQRVLERMVELLESPLRDSSEP